MSNEKKTKPSRPIKVRRVDYQTSVTYRPTAGPLTHLKRKIKKNEKMIEEKLQKINEWVKITKKK